MYTENITGQYEKGQKRGDRGHVSLRTPAIRLVEKQKGEKVDVRVKEEGKRRACRGLWSYLMKVPLPNLNTRS